MALLRDHLPRRSASGASFGHIHFQSRKNDPQGASVKRSCSCHAGPQQKAACGVCALNRRLAMEPRHQLRAFDSNHTARLRRLREACSRLVIQPGRPVGWHGFRRGRANDLLGEGHSISTILRAGGWRSSAILAYLLTDELQARMAAITTIEQSDSE